MGESFTDRHDRERGARSTQMDRVGQGLRDLRAVDEQVAIESVEEQDGETEGEE